MSVFVGLWLRSGLKMISLSALPHVVSEKSSAVFVLFFFQPGASTSAVNVSCVGGKTYTTFNTIFTKRIFMIQNVISKEQMISIKINTTAKYISEQFHAVCIILFLISLLL